MHTEMRQSLEVDLKNAEKTLKRQENDKTRFYSVVICLQLTQLVI